MNPNEISRQIHISLLSSKQAIKYESSTLEDEKQSLILEKILNEEEIKNLDLEKNKQNREIILKNLKDIFQRWVEEIAKKKNIV